MSNFYALADVCTKFNKHTQGHVFCNENSMSQKALHIQKKLFCTPSYASTYGVFATLSFVTEHVFRL